MITDSEEFAARRKAAYVKLDEAIAALHELFLSEEDNPESRDIAVDAVLLIGSQSYDEDGDRTGCVTICPRGGYQPGYITAGLLAMATAVVTAH